MRLETIVNAMRYAEQRVAGLLPDDPEIPDGPDQMAETLFRVLERVLDDATATRADRTAAAVAQFAYASWSEAELDRAVRDDGRLRALLVRGMGIAQQDRAQWHTYGVVEHDCLCVLERWLRPATPPA